MLGNDWFVLKNVEFSRHGHAITDEGNLVPAYVASQLGFSQSGRKQLDDFYSRLIKEAKVLPICPFKASGKILDLSQLGEITRVNTLERFWDEFNKSVGRVNYEMLMPISKFMIAILDGGHAVDDGVSAEIGFYASKYQGKRPIIGIRSDFRLAENISAPINPALRYFLDQGPDNGYFFSGERAYDEAIEASRNLAKKII